MENVSKACIVVGALLGCVGGIMGALFMTSDDFVEARISCINSVESGAECPADGFVQFNGEDCLVGNLGLYESAFTPDCADGTPYEINELVVAFEGDPLEFGPLFPAQTGLAGIAPGFAGIASGLPGAEEPEFESCEQYFAPAGDLSAFFTATAFVGIFQQVETIDTTIKGFYDGAIDQIFAGTNQVFIDIPSTIADIAYGALLQAQCVAAPLARPALLTDLVTFDADATTGACFDFTVSGTGTIDVTFLQLIQANTGVNGLVGLLALAISQGSGTSANIVAEASQGFAQDSVDEGNTIQGVGAGGMWASFASGLATDNILCDNIGLDLVTDPVCSYIRILEAFQTNIIDVAVPGGSDDLDRLVLFWQNAENGLIANVGDITDRQDLQNETVTNAIGVGITLAYSTFQAVTKNTVEPGDASPQLDDVGTIANYQAALSGNADVGTQSIVLLCGLVGEDPVTCSYLDLLRGASTSSLVDNATQVQLSLIVDILDTCVGEGGLNAVSFAVCLTQTAGGVGGVAYPQLQGLTLGDLSAQSVLGTLYSGIELLGNENVDAVLALAIPECKDDEKDAEAIENAQALAPAGTAFMFVGAVVGFLSFAKSSKMAGIVGGIVGLVGGILFLAALIGVQQAPVFDAVGEDGPLVDNEIVYETGAAAVVAAGTIGLGIAGPIVMIAGFVLQPKPDAGADIMSGGKY